MRKHLKHLKAEKGFTLIELLAVIVILGIIAAIAVPMIGNVIEDSQNKAEANEALSIISAAKLHHAEAPTDDATYDATALSKYVDIATDSSIIVTLNGTNWEISGHDINNVEGVTGPDADATDPLSEAELKAYVDRSRS